MMARSFIAGVLFVVGVTASTVLPLAATGTSISVSVHVSSDRRQNVAWPPSSCM